MKVRIVCYEDVLQWILGKFALNMQANLRKLEIEVDIAKLPDPHADINHHIIYADYQTKEKYAGVDTLMITHIDNISKLQGLKNQLQVAEMGICMSKETMINLTNLGIPRNKLCYVDPAHDGIIKPRKMVVGITCRVQKDGRKREFMVDDLAGALSPEDFEFKIMGEFWSPQVINLKNKGFSVYYSEHFNYEEYVKLIPSLDYYLYTGMDEGQMGFVDALCAGVKTIVTPQGYHLDAVNGITHKFATSAELLNIFKMIAEKRNELPKSVEKWTWDNYTRKHLEIWQHLLNKQKSAESPISFDSDSEDGLNSLDQFSQTTEKTALLKKIGLLKNLYFERLRQYYYIKKNYNRKD
jgi:hypothetical protein